MLFKDPALPPKAIRPIPVLAALCKFTDKSGTDTLPDMIHLQRLYKTRAVQEPPARARRRRPHGPVYREHICTAEYAPWGVFDRDRTALGTCIQSVSLRVMTCAFAADALVFSPKETASHLVLSALFTLEEPQPSACKRLCARASSCQALDDGMRWSRG